MANHNLYISCYSQRESELGTARGIYACLLDADTGALSSYASEDDSFNPSYMALTRDGRFLYAADEVDGQAMIAAYAIDADSRALTFVNRETYPGGSLCSINVGPNRRQLFAANYVGGNVLSVKALGDGCVGAMLSNVKHQGRSVNPSRQDRPYAHCAMPDPDARFLLCCDLGIDKVITYAIDAAGQLAPSSEAVFQPGEGPRHLVFDRAAERAFVVTELMCHVVSCHYDKATGVLSPVLTFPVLPAGVQDRGFTGADVQLSPDESMLYASVRDCMSQGRDVIAVYKVDGENLIVDGHLQVKHLPRSFAISPDGKWLVVACEGADAVQVIDLATRKPVSELRLPLPVCVKFDAMPARG